MYVRIKDGKIDCLVEANPYGLFVPEFAAQFVECDPSADYTWVVEGSNIVPPPPPPEPEKVYPRFVGNHKFDLFTQEEQLAVVTATMSDPIVKLFYDRLLNAAYLSYEDPETEQGLSLLVSKGLLSGQRKSEIVALMQPT